LFVEEAAESRRRRPAYDFNVPPVNRGV
jgi:hypothetical protein